MPTTVRPFLLLTDDGDRLAVTDTGCDGEVASTEDGTLWEAVAGRPGEWTAPGLDRTARTVR